MCQNIVTTISTYTKLLLLTWMQWKKRHYVGLCCLVIYACTLKIFVYTNITCGLGHVYGLAADFQISPFMVMHPLLVYIFIHLCTSQNK